MLQSNAGDNGGLREVKTVHDFIVRFLVPEVWRL